MKSKIIITVLTLVFFISVTFLTANKLYIKGGLDYYGYPLIFYTDYHDWFTGDNTIINYFNLILDLLVTTVFIFGLYCFNKYVLVWIVYNFSKISAVYFGIIYLSLIPSFAFIYFLMPNHFYKSTFEIEKFNEGFEKKPNLQYELTDEIGSVLSKNFIKYYKVNYIVSDRGDTLTDPIGTGSMLEELIKVDGSNLTIPIFIASRKGYSKILYFRIALGNLNFSQTMNDTVHRHMELDTSSLYDTSRVEYDINKLFPLNTYRTERKIGVLGPMYIQIDKKLQRKINSFVYGVNGYSFNEDFWSLFYFSTVTITTLGFGDIVPITRSSRLLVSSESILGVIFIGLFLNALFRDNKSKQYITNKEHNQEEK